MNWNTFETLPEADRQLVIVVHGAIVDDSENLWADIWTRVILAHRAFGPTLYADLGSEEIPQEIQARMRSFGRWAYFADIVAECNIPLSLEIEHDNVVASVTSGQIQLC